MAWRKGILYDVGGGERRGVGTRGWTTRRLQFKLRQVRKRSLTELPVHLDCI